MPGRHRAMLPSVPLHSHHHQPGGQGGMRAIHVENGKWGIVGLPTVRIAWRPSGAGGGCFRGCQVGRGDRPASPS